MKENGRMHVFKLKASQMCFYFRRKTFTAFSGKHEGFDVLVKTIPHS